MRLALALYGDLHTLSGGYLYDRTMVEAWRSLGDKVEVLTFPSSGYVERLADAVRGAALARVGALDWDVLLQDELDHPAYFRANQALRARGRGPVVSIVHHLRSSEPRPHALNWLYRQVEAAYLRSVDGFIFNTASTGQVVSDLLEVPVPGAVAYPGRDHVAPSISAAEIRARAAAPGPRVILFVGNLIRRKGLHTLVEALRRIAGAAWRLEVIGGEGMEPGYAASVRRRIRAAGLEERIRLLGPLGGAEVAERMARAHLLAVPSAYEGFGIAYLEGMGHGLPPIAAARGGAPELVEHGRTGFLVPPDDPEAVAACLEALLSDPRRLTEMSIAARERYERHPTWEESAQAARALFGRLLGVEAAPPQRMESVRIPT